MTAARTRQPAQARERARLDWNGARWVMICQRDALTCGLGWPHRGERVTVSTWRSRDGARVPYTGVGIYLHSSDVYNIMHAVWMPVFGTSHRKGTVSVSWMAPGDDGVLRGPADPAGKISMRVQDAPGRLLPVPLERWPGYSSSRADDAPPDPPALFTAADVPAPPSGQPARSARGRRGRPDAPARSPEEDLKLF